jgi:transcriptional pleiotropic regulator of transition state genes
MKTTGVTRKIDQLGRVVLPVELRRSLGLHEGDLVEVALDDGAVVLTKVEDRCVFCSTASELHEFAGKWVCRGCADRLTGRGG